MTQTLEKTEIMKKSGHEALVYEVADDFEIVNVTPELASQWLEKASTRANPDPRAIDQYKKHIEAGSWAYNAQPLIFDHDGRLIDGVQRLNAVIAADKPFLTAVAKDISADTLHTIDQHRRRSYSGVLESRGYKNAGSLLRTMSKLIRIENGVLGIEFRNISWSRYDRVLRANPELQEAIALADQFKHSEIHSTPRPVLAFMALKAGYHREIRSFLSDTISDETVGSDNAAKRLAFQLSSARAMGDLDHDRTLALSIMAFNDYLDGTVRSKPYAWKPDYGKLKVDEKNPSVERRQLLEHAPANLGLPVMKGDPRLAEGFFDAANFRDEDQLSSEIIGSLKGAARKSDGFVVYRVILTPEVARDWLARFNRENRKIQRAHIDMIARDIEKKQWMVNAQPICFHGDPLTNDVPGADIRLLNGQHRLHACVAANIPIEVYVAVNIAKEAFATFDTHAKKRIASEGVSTADARNLDAAAVFQWRVDNNIKPLSRARPSPTDRQQTIERHPEMADAMMMARKKAFDEIGPAGLMTFFIYNVMREGGKEVGGRYLEQLTTGAGIEAGNPVLRVISAVKGKRGEVKRRDVLQLLLENWEAYKEWLRNQEDREIEVKRQPSLI